MKIQTSQLFLYVKERRTEKHIFKWPNAMIPKKIISLTYFFRNTVHPTNTYLNMKYT